MSFQELIVLLPCHSLEDFPTHLAGVEADQSLTPAFMSGALKSMCTRSLPGGESSTFWNATPGPPGQRDDDEKRWCDGIYLAVQSTGRPVGGLLGVGRVLSAMG